MEENDTLQQQCGTENGVVQIQFTLKLSHEGGYKIDILDVLKANDSQGNINTQKILL